MPRPLYDLEHIKDRIDQRWQLVDWNKTFPWWFPPAKVRILVYMDTAVTRRGGGGFSLQHVEQVLTSQAYPYVDFDLTFVHRQGGDPDATIAGARTLDSLDLVKNYDQVWFFGFDSSTAPPAGLSSAEVQEMTTFMAEPKRGGVLVTGDHEDLGRSIAGALPRAGLMRQYPAPPNVPPAWNTTLLDGPDPGSDRNFDDQSDDVPQRIRWREYPISGLPFFKRSRPHPVMCSRFGPIDVFPDHQHEGEALAPVPAAGDPDWPTFAGHQEHPEVIAWGRITDPTATHAGAEIGIVSAYDGHNVDVGRIIADSTWHHWFDINLLGTAPSGPYAGFDATAAGQQVLLKVDSYFLNVGVWLSPPERLDAMRLASWWAALWHPQVLELDAASPIRFLGQQAVDVLNRWTPPCTVTRFVLDLEIFKEKIPWWEWRMILDEFVLVDLPVEEYVAGGILRRLLVEAGAARPDVTFPQEPIDPRLLAELIDKGAAEGLEEFGRDLRDQGRLATRFADSRLLQRRQLEATA